MNYLLLIALIAIAILLDPYLLNRGSRIEDRGNRTKRGVNRKSDHPGVDSIYRTISGYSLALSESQALLRVVSWQHRLVECRVWQPPVGSTVVLFRVAIQYFHRLIEFDLAAVYLDQQFHRRSILFVEQFQPTCNR